MPRFEQAVLEYGQFNRIVAHGYMGRSRTWVSLSTCVPNAGGSRLSGLDDLVIGLFDAPRPFDMIRDRGNGQERLRIRADTIYAIPWDCPRFVAWTGSYRFPSLAVPRGWVEAFLAEAVSRPEEAIRGFANLVSQDPAIAMLVGRLVRRLDDPAETSDVDDLYADQAVGFILAALLGHARAAERAGMAGMPDWRLRRVTDFIDDNLGRPLALDEMAAAAGLSRFHFCRSFKAATGRSPHDYLVERRLDRAKQLLRATREPLAAIARRVGFASPSRFGEAFRRRCGMTPSAWRAR